MGWMGRLFRGRDREQLTERLVVESGIAADTPPGELVELTIVGESFENRQQTLERIAGGRHERGAEHRVGVTLRREPSNPHDSDAVWVEVMGQHVGYVSRQEAAHLSPALSKFGGVAEAQGLVVGGWSDGESQGSFGIRVWLTSSEAARLNVPDRLKQARIELNRVSADNYLATLVGTLGVQRLSAPPDGKT